MAATAKTTTGEPSALARAAADAVLYDAGHYLHLLDLLDEVSLAVACPATGWTVRETIAHAADRLQGLTEPNLEPIPETAGGLSSRWRLARDRSLAAIHADPHLVPGLERSRHASSHALDLLEALPALREDGFVLDWALFPVPHLVDNAWLARRRAFIDAMLAERRKNKKKRPAPGGA